jgi:hypothetical protein
LAVTVAMTDASEGSVSMSETNGKFRPPGFKASQNSKIKSQSCADRNATTEQLISNAPADQRLGQRFYNLNDPNGVVEKSFIDLRRPTFSVEAGVQAASADH